jgi:predicted O-methyltransferase YrrM
MTLSGLSQSPARLRAVTTDLEALRAVYKNNRGYLRLVSDQTQQRLEKAIHHPRFPGATDPWSLELLGSVLRASRPRLVLELGTYIGFSSLVIGDVLAHNEPVGELITVEPDESAHEIAKTLMSHLSNVSFVHGYSTDVEVIRTLRDRGPFEIVYLDSSHAYAETLRELDLIFDAPLLGDGGMLILHDAAKEAAQFDPSGEGGVRRALDEWTSKPSYQMVVFEKPLVDSVPGLGLVTRGTDSWQLVSGGVAAKRTIAEQDEHLDALRYRIARMSERQQELRRLLTDAHDQLLQRDEELLESFRREIEPRDEEIAWLREVVAKYEDDLAKYERELDAIATSRIWRAAGRYYRYRDVVKNRTRRMSR